MFQQQAATQAMQLGAAAPVPQQQLPQQDPWAAWAANGSAPSSRSVRRAAADRATIDISLTIDPKKAGPAPRTAWRAQRRYIHWVMFRCELNF